MKRRNFFSKIGKGLLGLGVITAVPKTSDALPVETPIESKNPFALPTGIEPKGMSEDSDGNLYILDGTDDNIVIVGVETSDGGFKKTGEFTLPKDTQKT